jgi:hypothetical protein
LSFYSVLGLILGALGLRDGVTARLKKETEAQRGRGTHLPQTYSHNAEMGLASSHPWRVSPFNKEE